MKVKRLALLNALETIQQCAHMKHCYTLHTANSKLFVCAQQRFEGYQQVSMNIAITGKLLDDKVAIAFYNNEFDARRSNSIIKLLRLLECEEVALFCLDSNLSVTAYNKRYVKIIDENSIEGEEPAVREEVVIDENTYCIGTVTMQEIVISNKKIPTSSPAFRYTKEVHETLLKAKKYLSKDEYRQEMYNFIVKNNTIYATDSRTIYSAKFDCVNKDLLLTREIVNSKFIDCNVVESDKLLHIIGRNLHVVLFQVDAQNKLSEQVEIICSKKEEVSIDLDSKLIRLNSTISDDRVTLNFQDTNKPKIEILSENFDFSGESISEYSNSSKPVLTSLLASDFLTTLNLFNLKDEEMLSCDYSKIGKMQVLRFVLNDEKITTYLNESEEEIIERKEKYKNLELNFECSGWESWNEYKENRYKSVHEVQFDDLYHKLDNNYKQELKKLVLVDVEKATAVNEAHSKLLVIDKELSEVKKVAKANFELTSEGQELILVSSQISAHKKMTVNEETTILITELDKQKKLLVKKYDKFLAPRIADLVEEKNKLQKIVQSNPNFIGANIDQLANSNSHIAEKRETIETEYQDFLSNPSKYIRTPFQIQQEKAQNTANNDKVIVSKNKQKELA